MNRFMAAARAFFLRKEEGHSLVEYGLLLALMAAVCVAVIAQCGPAISNAFATFAGTI